MVKANRIEGHVERILRSRQEETESDAGGCSVCDPDTLLLSYLELEAVRNLLAKGCHLFYQRGKRRGGKGAVLPPRGEQRAACAALL